MSDIGPDVGAEKPDAAKLGIPGEFNQGAAPPSARKNFWKVTAWSVALGLTCGGALAGPTYWIYSRLAASAAERQRQAEADKTKAETTATAAQQNANEALQLAEAANSRADDSDKAAKADQAAKVTALATRDSAVREKNEALNAAMMAATKQAEAERLSDQDRQRADKADQRAMAADANAASAAAAAAAALADRAEAFQRIKDLQDALARADVDSIEGRRNAIKTLESLLAEPEYNDLPQRMRTYNDLARICLRQVVGIQAEEKRKGKAEAELQSLAAERVGVTNQAVNAASGLAAAAKAQRDLVSEFQSLYVVGRVRELSANLDGALQTYQDGAARCDEALAGLPVDKQSLVKSAKSRFLAAIVRCQLAKLASGETAALFDSLGSSSVSTVLQPAPVSLQPLLRTAQAAVEADNTRPDAWYSLGRVWQMIADQAADEDAAVDAYNRATEAFRQGLQLAAASPSRDNLEGTLVNSLYAAYVKADIQLRKADSTLVAVERYRSRFLKYQAAERRWSLEIQQLAAAAGYRRPQPSEQQRIENGSASLADWLAGLVQRVVVIQENRARYVVVEQRWATFNQFLADSLEFGSPQPEQTRRLAKNDVSIQKWIGMLRQRLADHLREDQVTRQNLAASQARLAPLARGEATWAAFAAKLANEFGVPLLLPPQEQRWTTRRAETERAIRDFFARLAEFAKVNPALTRNRIRSWSHYGSGVHRFNAREYEAAISEFDAAIEAYPLDARYYYFRGMARRLFRGDIALNADMIRGSELEKVAAPRRADVAAALEHVQGPLRTWVESYRPAEAVLAQR